MLIEIEENPNCGNAEQFVYNELSGIRPVRSIRATERGQEVVLDVIGVSKDGVWKAAHCVKIADSGAGYAFLIFGGEWGLRLKPVSHSAPWNLEDSKQWGEAFKIYGSEDDIVYETD